jgi:hypothetical protein
VSGLPTTYIVIAVGDQDERATPEDLEALQEFLSPLKSHVLDDPALVGRLNLHFLETAVERFGWRA